MLDEYNTTIKDNISIEKLKQYRTERDEYERQNNIAKHQHQVNENSSIIKRQMDLKNMKAKEEDH
jgi:hypothetical protein